MEDLESSLLGPWSPRYAQGTALAQGSAWIRRDRSPRGTRTDSALLLPLFDDMTKAQQKFQVVAEFVA